MINLQDIPDKPYRQFLLVNENDEIFNLNSRLDNDNLNEVFYHAPSNLGSSSIITTETQYYYTPVSSIEWTPLNPSGELIFKTYDQYANFIYFTSHSSNLSLIYKPAFTKNMNLPITPTVYAQCVISAIDKSEINNGMLKAPITFKLLEPWRTDKLLKIGIDTSGTKGKTYPYKYNYRYGSKSKQTVTINNLGSLPTFPNLKIRNYTKSFNINTRDFNTGEIIQTLAFNKVSDGSDIVIINCDPIDQYITFNGSNAYININPDMDSYIMLQPGTTILEMDSNDGELEVEYDYRYNTI